jgi:hypothetical protein
MTRQLIKGMTMLMLVVALALVSAVASYGQSSSTAAADIPFEFVVSGKTLAAGHYQLYAANTGGDVVTIRGAGQSAMSLTIGLMRRRASDEGKLVFHRYGNRYFLREIWNAGDNTGRQLPKSREEKAIQRELASVRSKTESSQGNYQRIEVALANR